MLSFENVTFGYPCEDTQMLSGLSFQVEDGDVVSIIGASGCGKSTIFRLINGLEKPAAGQVLVGGAPISSIKNFSAFMPQKDLLFPWRTILGNLCLPMELQGIPKKEQVAKCHEVLLEAGLIEYQNHFPHALSGGMKQRAAFARTLLSGAQMLLLDEPFSALDFLTRIDMQEWLLRQWEHYHKTILFITHDVEEAIFLSKTIFVIREGRPVKHMEQVSVPLDYPRNREDLKRPDIIELKETLIAALRQKVLL